MRRSLWPFLLLGACSGGSSGSDGGLDAAAPMDMNGDDMAMPADMVPSADLLCSFTGLPLDQSGGPPMMLSQTGLYADIATDTLAPSVRYFQTAHTLWADGATKRRWVQLPPCTKIDTSDPDHWSFPVGTRFWKEFTSGSTRVETRLIARTGTGLTDWVFISYQWNGANTEAVAVPNGVSNANGTMHDIPSQTDCKTCHEGLLERILGFGTVQLSHNGPGVNLAKLNAEGLLTTTVASYTIPEDSTGKARAALGYLHANCSHCHNPNGVSVGSPFSLRLSVGESTVAATAAYLTAVDVPVQNLLGRITNANITHRIFSGDVSKSCIPYRETQRGTLEQMPPIATKKSDSDGVTILTDWVSNL